MKYQILQRLASGGMAEIFLARMTSGLSEKLVVLKRIRPELVGEPELVTMFLDEARLATTLHHPNIVEAYEADLLDGAPYIAMEYLHGEDVGALMHALALKNEKLPLAEALGIVIGICAGLHHAHEGRALDGSPLEIVHRDVTPQNVIVTFDGSVKLVDFGIARASQREARTRFGTIKGKVPYMSPEQCQSDPLDRRSDLFSVGIMLWELTLGKRLYRGKSDFEVLKQIVEEAPPRPREVDPDYHPDLEAIVMRALQKDREQRWPTARELQAALEEFVRKKQLPVSGIALQQLMERAFAERVAGWREAQAQGKTLADHLTERRARRRWLWLALPVALLPVLLMMRPAPEQPVAIAPLPSPAPLMVVVEPTPQPTQAPKPRPHARPGRLVILTSPQCQVSVDGTRRGATPLELELLAGQHEVLLTNPQFHIRRSLTVTVPPGATVKKRLDFAE